MAQESLNEKIDRLNKEFAQFSNEIIKLKQNGKSAEEIFNKLGKPVENLKKEFKSITGEIRVNQNALKAGTEEYNKATSQINKLNSGVKNLENTFSNATKTQKGFSDAFKQQFSAESLGKAAGNLIKYVGGFKLFNAVVSVVKNITVDAAKAAIDYQAQLAQLSAVTGVSGDELERLSDNVLKVAGSTKFTSAEIVTLQTELAKLGFTTDEIIDSTAAIANIAQALGQQVGPVAQKVGQILNQFNLTAKESTAVGDVLVSTINNSALSFESFGTAIQYVGPLAAELGTSFTELSGAMALLADNGFTASRIGTGLRGILTELGTTGQDLVSIVRELADEEISFSEAIELVGKRAAAQLITLVNNVETLESAEQKYKDTGAAILASARQLDTFKGNAELLNSAWNAFLIGLGDFVAKSGLARLGLRLLSDEAADVAEGLDAISDLDAKQLSFGINQGVKEFEKLNEKGGDFVENLEAAKQAAVDIITDNSLAKNQEYLDLVEKIKVSRRQEGEALISGNRSLLGEARRNLQVYEKQLKDFREQESQFISAALDSELESQILINEAQEERNSISEEYKASFNELNAIREKENITLAEAKKQEQDVNKILDELQGKRDAIVNGELDALRLKRKSGAELTKLEEFQLVTLEAQAEAYDTQIGKFKNLFIEKDKLNKLNKQGKQTFDSEIDSLNRQIDYQKEILANRIAFAAVQRQILENQLASAKSDEDKEEIQGRIRELEERTLQTQQSTYNTINGLIDTYRGKLEKAGLTAEETAKATEKINDAAKKIETLNIDFDELTKAATRLGKDFQKRFGEQLKDGKELSADQQEFVNNYINGFLDKFENLDPQQREALRELVTSRLFASDPKDVAKILKKNLGDILGELQEVFEEYNETYLENKKATLEADLDAVKRKFKIEEDILKSQLDNQLITESQFRTKSIELQKNQIAQENSINKKIFDAEKASDLRTVGAETAEALASNILNNYEKYDFTTAGILAILSTAAVLASGAAKADAIRRREFVPVKFEQGGIVNGPSHSDGGVPFTVQGQGGYEMEGGEFIVNKRAASMHRDLLERINNSYKMTPVSGQYKFATGGLVSTKADDSVDYLKAIAEATISTAIQTSKPVRAFVTGKDLRTNETERRLRDRNDRI